MLQYVAMPPIATVPAPLLFSMQGPLRRVVYVGLFEGLAILAVTLVMRLLTQASLSTASGLAVGSSLIAMTWNLIFNAMFEAWERRQHVRGRSTARRVAHAIGFEGGLVMWLVPLFSWWLGIGLWQALWMELGLLAFFLVYTFVFTWCFDRLFGLPAAAS